MRRATATLAAAAVLGLASLAPAASITVLDEGYSAFNGYGPPAGGSWAAVSKDTTTPTAYGSASMKIDNHAPQEPYVHCRAALDTGVSPETITPTSASLSFGYKLNMDAGGPASKTLNFGLQWGDWGYLSGYTLSGAAELVADNAWHTAIIPFSGWTTAPAAGSMMDWMTITGDWSTDRYTLNMDHFVLTSPVPEPTTIGVLALGSLAMLRRRRA